MPTTSGGRTPSADTNVIGLNEPLQGPWYAQSNFFKQGGLLGRALNVIPMVNATGHLHDVWWNVWTGKGLPFNGLTNYGTMLPAALVTLGATVGNYTEGWEANPEAWRHLAMDSR